MNVHVGVDIGGTFTDTISIDPETGAVAVSKVPSTTHNQAVGFLSGLRRAGIRMADISWLVHGTTVGTNATLERNGAVCGLITTRGFRDIIELGRRERPHMFGLYGTFEPQIRRRNRIEVDEMDLALEKAAFNPVMSEARDRANGIYHPVTGDIVAQGDTGLPIFVGVMQYAVRSAIAAYPALEDGDVVMLNDPYCGGTHLMDVKLVRPFHYKGKRFAFLANCGHWTDSGGNVPGGFGVRATEIIQEGVRISRPSRTAAMPSARSSIPTASCSSRPRWRCGSTYGAMSWCSIFPDRAHR